MHSMKEGKPVFLRWPNFDYHPRQKLGSSTRVEMWHSENSPSSKGIVSSPCVASGLCSRKDKKKQAKEEKDRQKQVEKKRRRLEKALATSAAIRLELEKKKQRKREEEQRLDEEGAALAESVALYVLLDEDSEGVTHLGAYREIDFQGFTVLSESNNALLRANNYVPYLSSRGHFDCVLSSGVNRHNSTACTFIDFGANGLPLQSFTSQNEFIHSFNQSSQVALRMAHKNQGELAKNNSESRFHMCQEAITNAGVIIKTSTESLALHTLVDRNMYSIDACDNSLDSLML